MSIITSFSFNPWYQFINTNQPIKLSKASRPRTMLETFYLYLISSPEEFHISDIWLSSGHQAISFIWNSMFAFYTCKLLSLLLYLFNMRRTKYISLPVPSKKVQGASRDCSVVRSTSCSYRGIGFSCHHPHGGSQPHIPPILGYALSWPLKTPNTHMMHIHTCM